MSKGGKTTQKAVHEATERWKAGVKAGQVRWQVPLGPTALPERMTPFVIMDEIAKESAVAGLTLRYAIKDELGPMSAFSEDRAASNLISQVYARVSVKMAEAERQGRKIVMEGK